MGKKKVFGKEGLRRDWWLCEATSDGAPERERVSHGGEKSQERDQEGDRERERLGEGVSGLTKGVVAEAAAAPTTFGRGVGERK